MTAADETPVIAPVGEDLPVPGAISDEELTALALAADPDQPLDADAVPLSLYLASSPGPLPEWYMAPVTARHSGRRQRAVILSIVGAFLLIEAFGLCSTYGQFPFH
ncbi:MAG TPA: hypothetical protein VK215_16425 [Acidimicrobiales bacterium]|nr:hypothetical protein [Acidimicrobiales bacterium]HLN44046.1 hypothetical protein [Acidimicrobiales bacterium]